MADEKLNTSPAENISPEAAEPIATPEQAAASEPRQEQTRPTIPEPGDVVVPGFFWRHRGLLRGNSLEAFRFHGPHPGCSLRACRCRRCFRAWRGCVASVPSSGGTSLCGAGGVTPAGGNCRNRVNRLRWLSV